tara:strand:- start:337 stop:1893 length:1557 start_codon:yes stop_codon:yes gene_type:complete
MSPTIRNKVLLGLFLIITQISYSQFSSITGSSITNDNIRINIVFDEEIYSNSSCSSLTCIEISDFSLSLSGGNATLGSSTPLTITKLGNYNFVPYWNGGEPNDCCNGAASSEENYAQHVGTGRLNDLPNGNNLAGVLEIINPNQQVIAGYTYIVSWPVGSSCAHSYYRSNTTSSWTDEKLKAQNAGGDLLVYNSVEEYQFLVPAYADNSGVADTWIGLSQDVEAADYSEPTGGWYWDDGTPIDNSASKLTYQLTFSLIGTPTGDEIVSINPILNPRSVFNCAGEFGIIQTNNLNKVRLFDKLSPYIIETKIADDNSYVEIKFNEEAFTDVNDNDLLVGDFILSIVQNGGSANLISSTPTSIVNIGNRIFRLGLPLTGHIKGLETISVNPLTNSSIYDRSDNPSFTSQTNNFANLNRLKTGPIYVGINYGSSSVTGTLQNSNYSFFCSEINGINYNLAYHDGPNLEPDVGESLIYNYLYNYPHRLISGDDFAFLHLKDFDKIIEVRKSDGLILAKYNCD